MTVDLTTGVRLFKNRLPDLFPSADPPAIVRDGSYAPEAAIGARSTLLSFRERRAACCPPASGGTVRLSNDAIETNQTGISNSGQALTYSNDRIFGNGSTAVLTAIQTQ